MVVIIPTTLRTMLGKIFLKNVKDALMTASQHKIEEDITS